MLVAEASRGIVLPSFYLYVAKVATINNTDAAQELGIATALFSVGRLLANLGFGKLLDYFSIRHVLAISLMMHAIGQLLYMFVGQYNSIWLLHLSRLIIGIGSSSLGVNRSFITVTVPSNERTTAFSLLSGTKFIGYALTPGIAVFFDINVSMLGGTVDKFTLPAIILCLSCFILIPFTLFGMSNVSVSKKTKLENDGKQLPTLETDKNNEIETNQPINHVLPPDSESESFVGKDKNADPEVEKIQLLPHNSISVNTDDEIAQYLSLATVIDDNDDTKVNESVIVQLSNEQLYFYGTVIFVFLNIATKGALTLCEVTIGSSFAALYDGPADSLSSATSKFLLYLGLVGLVTYLSMVLKPSGKDQKNFDEQFKKEQEQQQHMESLNSLSVNVKSNGETIYPKTDGDDGLIVADSTKDITKSFVVAKYICCLRTAFQKCFFHCQRNALEYDNVLLLFSQILSVIALIMIAPSNVSLMQLSIGYLLIWSTAGPVADILTVSLYSVLLTNLNLNSKVASSMAWITAAGSLGRILFPLCFMFAAKSDVLFAGAIVSIICALCTIYYLFLTDPRIGQTFTKCSFLRNKSVTLHELEDIHQMELPLIHKPVVRI